MKKNLQSLKYKCFKIDFNIYMYNTLKISSTVIQCKIKLMVVYNR